MNEDTSTDMQTGSGCKGGFTAGQQAVGVTRWSAVRRWLSGCPRRTRAVGLPKHADEHRPECPVLLAVDQELGEGAALWVAPARRPSSEVAKPTTRQDLLGKWPRQLCVTVEERHELIRAGGREEKYGAVNTQRLVVLK